MSLEVPGEVNPFEAPRAGIGEDIRYRDVADNDAELIRREHLGREANIKFFGLFLYLMVIFASIGLVFCFLLAIGVVPITPNPQEGIDPASQKILFAMIAAGCLVAIALYGGLGYGLTNLQVWARWTMVVLFSLGLANNLISGIIVALANPSVGLMSVLIGSLFPGLFLYLFVSSKAGVVFSREYKEVIRKTPHIKPKISLIVKILVGLLLMLLVLGAVGGIISYFSNR